MMRSIVIGIVSGDHWYIMAFMKAVALDHAGFIVKSRERCGEGCERDVDVCIRPMAAPEDIVCDRAMVPACGMYAGVSAILREVNASVLDRRLRAQSGLTAGHSIEAAQGQGTLEDVPPGTLICIYSCYGGAGASTAAIGIGRELARYRGERAMYLSLEDKEDRALFPAGIRAMNTCETVYRYMRTVGGAYSQEDISRLFCMAAACDEYKLLRLAPDDDLNRLASMPAGDLYIFLGRVISALSLTRLVLDFGTKLQTLSAIAAYLEEGTALFIEVVGDGTGRGRNAMPGLDIDAYSLKAQFPRCGEDVRLIDGRIEVGLANTFGLAVKEACDRIIEGPG